MGRERERPGQATDDGSVDRSQRIESEEITVIPAQRLIVVFSCEAN